jgi:tripartite-type tricarboxylate transporter receptor subunit TctC
MNRKRTSPLMAANLLMAASLLLALAAPAAAQSDYPNRPIRVIIPFPAGGSNDIVGRAITMQMGERLGKQMVIDNRTGAGGVIGSEAASHAAPDGYTILVISISHAVNPWLYKLPYDPSKAFMPVGFMGTGTNVLTVHPSLPVNSLKDLLAMAKEKPGELTYASAGVGTFQHLGAELFKLDAKVNLLHVPFRGGGPALVDVLGGHNKIMFSSLVQAVPHIKTGRLRPLGTGGKERVPALAEVPTISEAGVPGYEAQNWWGLLAPVGTPQPIIARLHKALEEAQDTAVIQEQFAKEGAATRKMSTADFGKFVEAETRKWERVIKESGIKAQ